MGGEKNRMMGGKNDGWNEAREERRLGGKRGIKEAKNGRKGWKVGRKEGWEERRMGGKKNGRREE